MVARARCEFAALVAYTEKRSPRGAARMAQRILKRIDDLSQFRDQGVPIGRGTRRLEVAGTPYLIFYRSKRDRIVIIGVVHVRRRRRS